MKAQFKRSSLTLSKSDCLFIRRPLFLFTHMTTDDALKRVHELYEKNTDYPTAGEEDYDSRLALLGASINKWASKLFEGTFWKELFDTHNGVTNTSSQGDAPSDWMYPGGSLWIGANEYKYVRPERATKTIKQDPSAKIYWITGATGAQKVNINPAPGVGVSFVLDYYHTPFIPETGAETTELEMGDAYFAIYDVLTQLYLDDDNTTQADFNLNLANEKMAAMQLSNETTPFYQSNALEDVSDPGFGT